MKKYSDIFVSVIMPVYNGEAWVAETIESILNQTHSNFEFIIVDDCSTDGSHKILQKYALRDERIKIFKTPKNFGNPGGSGGYSINKVSPEAKYIIPTDQDDVSVKDRLETQISFMEEHPEVDISGGWMKFFISKSRVSKPVKNDEDIKARLLTGCSIAHPTSIFRKSFFDKNNLNYRNQFCQDYQLWSDAALKYGAIFHNIQKVLLYYRAHDKQVSKTNAVKEASNRVREYQLRKLGFTNQKEIDFHNDWKHKKIKMNKENLKKLEKHLRKIMKLNEKNTGYPPSGLENRLTYLYKKSLLRSKKLPNLLKALFFKF